MRFISVNAESDQRTHKQVNKLTAVKLVTVVPTVVDGVTSLGHGEAHVVRTSERPEGWALQLCCGKRERERERDTHTHTERETHTQTHTQTHTDTHRHTQTHTDTYRHTQTHLDTPRHTQTPLL